MMSNRAFIQFCVAVSIALLPLAHLKLVVFGIPLYSVEAPVLLALAAYLYGWKRGAFSRLEKINFFDPLVIGAGIFFLGAVVSFFANPFSFTGLGMLKSWFVFPLLGVWLWLRTEPTARDIERILLVWFLTISVAAILSGLFLLMGEQTYDGRLAAWYASPNYLALFLAPGTLLAHYFYFHPDFQKKKFLKLAFFLMLLIIIVVLFFTHSYAAWISIALAGLLYLLLDTTIISSWRKKSVAIALLLVIFGMFTLFESGSEKWHAVVSFQERSSLMSRVTIWRVAARVISDHPIFGIGIGRFQEVYLEYQKYFPPYLEWAVPQPHSLYLALWLETGLMGLFGFVLLTGAWLRKLFALQRSQSEDTGVRKLSALFIAWLSFYLMVGTVDTPFFKTDSAFALWFLLVFGISLLNMKKALKKEL